MFCGHFWDLEKLSADIFCFFPCLTQSRGRILASSGETRFLILMTIWCSRSFALRLSGSGSPGPSRLWPRRLLWPRWAWSVSRSWRPVYSARRSWRVQNQPIFSFTMSSTTTPPAGSWSSHDDHDGNCRMVLFAVSRPVLRPGVGQVAATGRDGPGLQVHLSVRGL